jgi:hypothetical protein
MADFHVSYVGHISFEGQANGLPAEIRALQLIENVQSKRDLIKTVEAQGTQFIMASGMAVSKDPSQIRDPEKLDVNRMFVYSHWIVYIDVEIKQITNTREQLAAAEDGTEAEETKN